MIIRLSQKLNARIKAGKLSASPLDEKPLADWSAHLFAIGRTQYIILSNTETLYSTVFYADEIKDDSRFIQRALNNLQEFMADAGQQHVYQRFIAPASATVRFAKALDRTVTGSMNELILHASAMLAEDELSPYDVGFKLNDVLLSALGSGKPGRYGMPREAFKALVDSISP